MKKVATKEEIKQLAARAKLKAEQGKIKNFQTYDLSHNLSTTLLIML